FPCSGRGASSPKGRRRKWWTIRAWSKLISATAPLRAFRPQESPMPDALLAVSELTAGYGATEVLRGISLEVAAGAIVAVVGSDGAGKARLSRPIASARRATRRALRFSRIGV